MLFLHFVLVAAGAISHTLDSHLTRSDPVLVRAVTSGDTIEVAAIGRVHLLGIDAPGVGRTGTGSASPSPYGREARDRLASLVLNRWVRLERDEESPRSSATGQRSVARRPAYVMTEEGTFVNAVLLREGLARVSPRGSPSRLAELQRAEIEARAAHRGLWSVTADTPRTQRSETYRVPKPPK